MAAQRIFKAKVWAVGGNCGKTLIARGYHEGHSTSHGDAVHAVRLWRDVGLAAEKRQRPLQIALLPPAERRDPPAAASVPAEIKEEEVEARGVQPVGDLQ